ncbi:MAG TPA: hypothetical protein VF519_13480 [Mycobacteriales bacterium]
MLVREGRPGTVVPLLPGRLRLRRPPEGDDVRRRVPLRIVESLPYDPRRCTGARISPPLVNPFR